MSTELITTECYIVDENIAPLNFVMQHVYKFYGRPDERVNRLVSFTPGQEYKTQGSMVALFKLTKIKKNVRTN